MKKRTSRLLSVLLTLVMVLGLLPVLGTTALAVEDFDLYLEVGENAFDMPEMKHAISGLTYGQTEELGVYRQWIEPPYGDRCWLGVRSERIDGDILSRDGLAKSPGKVVLTIEKVSGKNIMLVFCPVDI